MRPIDQESDVVDMLAPTRYDRLKVMHLFVEDWLLQMIQ